MQPNLAFIHRSQIEKLREKNSQPQTEIICLWRYGDRPDSIRAARWWGLEIRSSSL